MCDFHRSFINGLISSHVYTTAVTDSCAHISDSLFTYSLGHDYSCCAHRGNSCIDFRFAVAFHDVIFLFALRNDTDISMYVSISKTPLKEGHPY